MIKKYSSQFALALVLMMASISCNWIDGNRGNMVIKGTFTKFPGKKITLMEVDLRKTIPIDTVNLDEEGEFRFRFDRDSAGIYLLKVDNRNFITLVLDEEETVEVYSDMDLIQSGYLVEGSEISRKLAEYESALQRNKDIVDSLVLKYNQGQARFSQSSVQLRMDEKYQETFEDQVELSRRFIEDNCGSLAALLVLEKRFGMRKILDEEKEGEYYIMVDSCLKEKYSGNKHQLDFSERIQYIKQRKAIQDHRDRMLSPGSKVPDITLEDPKGKSISLYSFSGNKVILYFWASWDKKSRSSNQEMKRVYELYHPKGLQIYAVSLESYRDTWESAIRADALPWTNVTDYLNIQSGAVSLFNVPDEFPYFFLLNENMEILYKGSSFVRLLELLESSMN